MVKCCVGQFVKKRDAMLCKQSNFNGKIETVCFCENMSALLGVSSIEKHGFGFF